jgi:tRNA G18 (ribose-2'-O)-methylase SpoU
VDGAANLPEAITALKRGGYRVIALTTAASARPLREVAAEGSDAAIAFVLGSEGFGLSGTAVALADTCARIPMAGPRADSLNVAAAASIALYENGV